MTEPGGIMKSGPQPGRNLALELVRLTEAAALAAGRWVGRGDKNAADGAAVDAMRSLISTVAMNGVVVIGEGEKDQAPMLYNGERVGDGSGPEVDVAVDPIDGTTLTGKGQDNALSVLAVADRGAMYDPSAVFYMDKLACGPEGHGVVDIRLPVSDNIRALARAKGEEPQDITVVVLDRPRHESLVADIRASGARIKFISDGDVAGAIMAARPDTGIDLMVGVGGTPEGIIAACALKCLGGVLQGRLWPRDDAERARALDAGHDLDRVLGVDDLVVGDAFFVATGITDGELLRGVRYFPGGAATSSLVMRSRSGTIRRIEATHQQRKVEEISGEEWELVTEWLQLPEGLPAPVDDGAADHLAGMPVPALALPSTSGGTVDLAELSRTGSVVVYAFPRTGRPGEPSLVPDWDDIPGARGCTPESCGFRDVYAELAGLGVTVLGLSTQDTDYQGEAVERLQLPFAMVSDDRFALTDALRLPTFEVAGQRLLKRLTLLLTDAVVEHVWYPVFPPDTHAQEVLGWLQTRRSTAR